MFAVVQTKAGRRNAEKTQRKELIFRSRGETLETVKDIRKAFTARYPEVDDDEFSARQSGFVHEHPITAIGIVLISSIVLGTCDPTTLGEFTKYSERFIRAIAANMENNRLWQDNKYQCSSWSSGNLLPRDQREDNEFWDHILIAEGSAWEPSANSESSEDTCAIFWGEKLVN